MFLDLLRRALFLEGLAKSRGVDLTVDPSTSSFLDFRERHNRQFMKSLELDLREANLREAERERDLQRRERLAGIRP